MNQFENLLVCPVCDKPVQLYPNTDVFDYTDVVGFTLQVHIKSLCGRCCDLRHDYIPDVNQMLYTILNSPFHRLFSYGTQEGCWSKSYFGKGFCSAKRISDMPKEKEISL
jgi:hypothetical protein